MGIPLAFFYYLYLLAVGVFLLFTLFNVYHLIRFGFLNLTNIIVTAFFIGVSIMILLISWQAINQFNWNQMIILTPITTL
ncbi:MAG: hypothetical protein A2729_04905 [Candidatus Buchananbacteria bacterium RIFCSPHIGHO2_01_FULL_39_14]|uniref:Uncharacterized protein n=2 Tax=Candidatus Buchananiibacteriota TaxID=1817903 RepID=A0A1G1YNY2_9BACT|nr:MAG: hypothetical protein A2729_04905 [Candidatus Buchananbacteria bacterium RIFCSPHIGHO2_01_FULL_39_14]OGY49712.1 MAG: hypothetical protein A3D39_04300 [Candidatus Buchananbacteria bacterium RIFCSPHIGHO2_02_FULL_39_17]OGY54063.1 MAG: hypothetical protein A2912_01685 [Candidatus Buchananbacteria bacterium RIFCSPLOWO2_01_FULL_40_23b]